jgi:hypothetical protein
MRVLRIVVSISTYSKYAAEIHSDRDSSQGLFKLDLAVEGSSSG